MNIITKKTELSTVIEKLKSEGKTVGLVPTMGALHEGHISLVKACKKGNDIAVVSVFVNPTQFNDKEDLKRYPRTLDKDVALLEKNGCDYVFAPSVEEMYPEEDTRVFNFGYVESVMEGAKRPGHFNGVGQIVSKLFDIVRPHRAYFGMKDFQQIAETLAQLKPDLLLLDINLPYYDGFYWCETIRRCSMLPILFISSRDQDQDKIMAMMSGGDDYLQKPFSLPC